MKPAAVAISAALAVLACAAAIAPVACDDVRGHIYAGRRYDPDRGCLEPPSSIDIVDGDDPGLGCARTCIEGLPGDGGEPPAVYVSTMCPPYPTLFDVTGKSLECAAALAAAASNALCGADAGSSKLADAGPDAPPADAQPADASPDAPIGDASTDAPLDAADGS